MSTRKRYSLAVWADDAPTFAQTGLDAHSALETILRAMRWGDTRGAFVSFKLHEETR